MNDLLERPGMSQISTDWAENFTQREEELSPNVPEANREFPYMPEEVGATALADSVRITLNESVRITAREDSVRITAQDDSVRITAQRTNFGLAA